MPRTNLNDIQDQDMLKKVNGGLEFHPVGEGTITVNIRKHGTTPWSKTEDIVAPYAYDHVFKNADLKFTIPTTITSFSISEDSRCIMNLDYEISDR